MKANAPVEFVLGDMFLSRSDLVVMPCSTSGTITQVIENIRIRYNLPAPPMEMRAGEIYLIPNFIPEHHSFRHAAYAASVAGNSSTSAMIRDIGESLGALARTKGFKVIAVPLLGAGAGKLGVEVAARSLIEGFGSTAPAGAKLLVHAFDGSDVARLRRTFEHWGSENTGEVDSDRRKEAARKSATKRTSVFISYSHKDKKWLQKLQVHLKPLEKNKTINRWDDTVIKPGTKWKEEIKSALDSAKVAVLLISPDFLASDYIAENELPPLLSAAKEEGAVILPVILSHCRFLRTESLSSFQAVNDPAKPLGALSTVQRDKIFSDLVDTIQDALKA